MFEIIIKTGWIPNFYLVAALGSLVIKSSFHAFIFKKPSFNYSALWENIKCCHAKIYMNPFQANFVFKVLKLEVLPVLSKLI